MEWKDRKKHKHNNVNTTVNEWKKNINQKDMDHFYILLICLVQIHSVHKFIMCWCRKNEKAHQTGLDNYRIGSVV